MGMYTLSFNGAGDGCRRTFAGIAAWVLTAAGVATGAPAIEAWPVDGADDTAAVAASALAGWYACADAFEDTVEFRDVRGQVMATVTRAQIAALVPWLGLTGGPDGPSAVALSDSGRLAFILVSGAPTAPDSQPSDAVLRYDTTTGALTVFSRQELFDRDDQFAHIAAVHHRARLFIGSKTNGVRVLSAAANTAAGGLITSAALPDGGPVRGLAIDREQNLLYAASATNLYRATATATPPVFTLIGAVPGTTDVRGIAFSEQYGGTANAGLYVLSHAGGASGVTFVPTAQARGTQTFAPSAYHTLASEAHSISATADGRLLIGTDEDAVMLSDSSDSRLGFDAWVQDEFNQVVAFARGLIDPDGEPDGWVIDADVQQGWSRFHPATPDGACWTVLALLMADRVNADPSALNDVRRVLRRYSGQAPDGVKPSKSADGYMRHWIDPTNGSVKPGWPTEFAVYSTMKILAAADRAAQYFPNDPDVQRARKALVAQVTSWDAYIDSIDRVHLVSLPGGGPDPGPRNPAFTEGILFVEQAAQYGGAWSVASFSRWINRALWPTATFLTGRPITGEGANVFHSAFIDVYPLLLQAPYRADAAWSTNVRNVLDSNGGWTDDNGPKYFTVFSAGTTRSDWGGYRADNLSASGHPGNVTTFPSLMGFCATGRTSPAVSAYHAYRRGARQTFLGGASILYRRSDVDRSYQPDSAGLPDVVLGGLGLAELLSPGSVDAVLARTYLAFTCAGDFNFDGVVNTADLAALLGRFGGAVSPQEGVDLNSDGAVDTNDLAAFLARFGQACP